jgi:hypothetical protein
MGVAHRALLPVLETRYLLLHERPLHIIEKPQILIHRPEPLPECCQLSRLRPGIGGGGAGLSGDSLHGEVNLAGEGAIGHWSIFLVVQAIVLVTIFEQMVGEALMPHV